MLKSFVEGQFLCGTVLELNSFVAGQYLRETVLELNSFVADSFVAGQFPHSHKPEDWSWKVSTPAQKCLLLPTKAV